jgi:hypothetical protein
MTTLAKLLTVPLQLNLTSSAFLPLATQVFFPEADFSFWLWSQMQTTLRFGGLRLRLHLTSLAFFQVAGCFEQSLTRDSCPPYRNTLMRDRSCSWKNCNEQTGFMER